ncbi:hypothetical protein P7C71_g788, partial [Lecanoromycetidae sp. Uapishka_2]
MTRNTRGKNKKQNDLLGNACTDRADASQSEGVESSRSSVPSSCSDDDADAEVSDDNDDEDDDGNAIAPSGCAMNKHGNQAGRPNLVFKNGPPMSKKRRASLVGLENPDQNTKHARSSPPVSASLDDSDDEAYNAVDLVSDANEDESEVEKLEEKDIINSEDGSHVVAEFAIDDVGEASEGLDDENNFILPDMPYFDEQYSRIEHGTLDGESRLLQSTYELDDFKTPTSPGTPTPRRVRFKDPLPQPSHSSDIISNDDDLNVLFNTNESSVQASDETIFDFGTEDAASSVGSCSGYETDYGESTEEDDKRPTTRPQSVLRRPSLSSINADTPIPSPAIPSPFKMPGAPASSSLGPRLGTFKVNPNKPCAMVDSSGKKMLIIRAKHPTRNNTPILQGLSTKISTACPSPITSPRTLAGGLSDNDIEHSGFSSRALHNPMLASGPNVPSFPLPSSGNSNQSHDQTLIEPPHPSVFLPQDSLGEFKALFEDGDDGEALLNVTDFIDFGVDSSVDEEDGDEHDEDAIARATLPTPLSTSPTVVPNQIPTKTPSPDSSSTNQLLKHLDKGVIGSFRRGQSSHQQHSHRPQAGPPLNKQAFKGGRHAAANAQWVRRRGS